MQTRVLFQSAPKTVCSFSSTPIMLHIKFDQDWPTGFRDIQVWKCGRRQTDDGQLVYYKLYYKLTLWAFGSSELKMCFCQKKKKKKKCPLSITEHRNEYRISFWPSVERTWQILSIPFRTFLLFNAVCIGKCYSLLCLIKFVKNVKNHILCLGAQNWMRFSVLHLQSCGQYFQTKVKISGQKTCF